MFVAMRNELDGIDSTRVLPEQRIVKRFTWIRQTVVAVIGSTVLLVGIAMIVLPGPAVVVIPLGLAILATEFVWAQRLLARARARLTGNNQEEKKQK